MLLKGSYFLEAGFIALESLEIILIRKLVFLVYVAGIFKFKMCKFITGCTKDTQLLVFESKGTQLQNVVTHVCEALPGLKRD